MAFNPQHPLDVGEGQPWGRSDEMHAAGQIHATQIREKEASTAGIATMA